MALVALCLIGTQAVFADPAYNITSNRDIYIKVANDNGPKYDLYGNGTVYFSMDQNGGGGGGLNPIQLSTDPSNKVGQITTTTNQSGTFYVVFSGGIQHMDDGILMLAVNGTIPDDFRLHIKASGFNYTPTYLPQYNNKSNPSNPDYSTVTYVNGTLDETFNKSDFIYYPQNWKLCSNQNYSIFNGEDQNNPANSFYLMFIDLNAGAFATNAYSGVTLPDSGSIKVEYSFTNLSSFAAFGDYGWFSACNWGTGIPMTNDITKSGYNVIPATQPMPAPVASFTSNVTDGTAPLTVQFTDSSINSPLSWSWNFGDGNTSTLQNPTHTYSALGTYNVSLNATNSAGSNFTIKTGYITVGQFAPVASFTSNVTGGGAPLAVQFTDTSANGPASWSWNFGDGNTSTLQNPTHTYSALGTYNVSLNATNSAGSNFTTKTGYINVRIPWATRTLNMTFHKSDFAYGPQNWVPYSDSNNYIATGGPTDFSVMYIDLGATPWSYDNSYQGGVKVNYNFSGLSNVAAFNVLGFSTHANTIADAPGVCYINTQSGKNASGYFVQGNSPLSGTIPTTVTLGSCNDNYLKVANPASLKYNTSGNGTFWTGFSPSAPSQGKQSIRITDSMSDPDGNMTWSTGQSGTFYITSQVSDAYPEPDDVILMLAVNGTVPDTFSANIQAYMDYVPPQVPYTVVSRQGWNLISFPVQNDTLLASSVPVSSGIDKLATYNGSTQLFGTFLVGKSHADKDFHLVPDNGYFFNATLGNVSQTFTGVSVDSPRTLTLYPTWNLIGWSSSNNMTALSFSGLQSNITKIARYDSATGLYAAYLVGLSHADKNFVMSSGNGYFVNTNAAAVKTVNI